MNQTTLLAILQQSEYDFPRFEKWVNAHPDFHKTIEPEAWTPKLKAIRVAMSGLSFLPPLLRIKVALILTQPVEYFIRQHTYRQAEAKLNRLRRSGLQIVAVAGSYAKTSVKHQLAGTVGREIPLLITPKSINTMLGISQVILNDLQPEHKLFVVEMGEFKSGQVLELLQFIEPEFGVLTPIGHQHIELLGSFENVIKEFTDFAHFFANHPGRLLISDRNREYIASDVYYGDSATSNFRVSTVIVTRAGTEYQVHVPHAAETQSVFTPLFGEHQAVNSLPAFWLADHFNLDLHTIAKHLATLPYIHRRHEPTFAENNVLLLDNSYNTNPDSIKDSFKLLNQLDATHRIMITAGFVEQGDEATDAHFKLGELAAKQLDYLGLFACSYEEEVKAGFQAAGGNLNRITTGATQAEVVESVQSQIIPGTVIIFEGGHQEIHS